MGFLALPLWLRCRFHFQWRNEFSHRLPMAMLRGLGAAICLAAVGACAMAPGSSTSTNASALFRQDTAPSQSASLSETERAVLEFVATQPPGTQRPISWGTTDNAYAVATIEDAYTAASGHDCKRVRVESSGGTGGGRSLEARTACRFETGWHFVKPLRGGDES
jgi:hypothetical protein